MIMKTIKDLTVKVTYTVSLCDVEVNDDVYEQLISLYDKQEKICECDWLADNIYESDAFHWEYRIVDLTNNKKRHEND